jgi:hypothetical protein
MAGEDVGDSADKIAAWYRHKRFTALGVLAVDSITHSGVPTRAEVHIDEADSAWKQSGGRRGPSTPTPLQKGLFE